MFRNPRRPGSSRIRPELMPAVLQLPCLCLVADVSVTAPDELVSRAAAAVRGGVGMVQLRAKEMPGGPLLSLASELQRAVAGRALLLVNERADVAAAAGADGVQLGEAAMPVAAARGLLPEGMLIGRSAHSAGGAARAASDGADLVALGAMFATASHPGAAPAGPGLMREAALRCAAPLIGIGGITPGNLAQVVHAGASGVAVIRNIMNAPDPQSAAAELKLALDAAWQARPSLNLTGGALRI